MSVQTAGTVRRRVSLVILAVDSFTDQPILGGSLRVWAECGMVSAKRPVRKPEGYYVFTDMEAGPAVLYLQGGGYEPQQRKLSVSQEGAPFCFMRVRMTPGRTHPMAARIVRIQGTAEPGSRIFGVIKAGDSPKRLLCDYRCGREESVKLWIYLPYRRELTDRAFFIEDAQNGQTQFFTVRAQGENGLCFLSEPLAGNYGRASTVLYPAFVTIADGKGNYSLVLCAPGPGIGENTEEGILEIQGRETHREIFRYRPGSVMEKPVFGR